MIWRTSIGLILLSSLLTLLYLSLYSTGITNFHLRSSSRGSLFPASDAFPRRIWQTSKENFLQLTDSDRYAVSSWLDLNPLWRYELLTHGSMETLVKSSFASRPEIVDTFTSITDSILRVDLGRYLALFAHGGVYADIDTFSRQKIEDWIPVNKTAEINLVIGIEYDNVNGERWAGWSRDWQIAIWTMLAKPGHPLLEYTVTSITAGLHALAEKKGIPLSQLKPSFYEVLDSTGPAKFTDCFFEYISQVHGRAYSWIDFTRLKEPIQVGDILLLPVHAFGCGQPHSDSGSCDDGTALVQHLWKGSWKEEHKLDAEPDRPSE